MNWTFWRRPKPHEPSQPIPVKPRGPIQYSRWSCCGCSRDCRDELLQLRLIPLFSAAFIEAGTLKAESLDVSDFEPVAICRTCALSNKFPGLDAAKLRALYARIQNQNPIGVPN